MNSAEKVKLYLKENTPTFWGKFFYYCVAFRRKIVLENIKLIFGETLSETEQIKFAQCFYSHLAKFIKENLKLRCLTNQKIQEQVLVQGEEYLLQALRGGKGVLLLSGHFGNWELAPVGAFLRLKAQFGTQKIFCIRKTFSHRWVDNWIFRPFQKAGIEVIPKDQGLRQTLRALKQGHGVIVVFDQHASPGVSGILTQFFDKPVGSYRSLAKLAKATNSPVIPISYFRLASGQQLMQFHPEIPFISNADDEEEQRINTQAYNDFIEQMISAYPEQWIWMHRRWKYFTKNQHREEL